MNDPAFGSSPIFRNGIFIKNRNFLNGLQQSPNPVDALIHKRDVSDGLSNTLMVSEKSYNSSFYKEPQFGDRLGFISGFGVNTLRSGARRPVRDAESDNDVTIDRFGAAHPYSMNALFADGSVRQISYSLPDNPVIARAWTPLMIPFGVNALPSPPNPPNSMYLTLMQRLCHRSDGAKVELTLIED